jgi:hypothetical protein
MPTLTIPLSGHLLVAHLAAYGLGAVLDAAREDAFVGHDPLSLEIEAEVTTSASVERAAQLIRQSADECERAVEADVYPGKSGNDRRAAIWARSTKPELAGEALPQREALLDSAERDGASTAIGLLAGMGLPAVWSGNHPENGASALDGVFGNNTSDFVRGLLRRVRPAAASAQAHELEALWSGSEASSPEEDDRTGWSPRGTRVDHVHQWLAALGLGLLPVGQSSQGTGQTPCCFWREGHGVTLPVFKAPVSLARLRALLQRPELKIPPAALGASEAARLRSFGIEELVTFARIDRGTTQSVAFTFARGDRIEL